MKTKFFPSSILKTSGLGPREVKAVITTSSADRAGDIVEPGGADLSNYLKNPIVLANHDRHTPIGTAKPTVFSDRIEALIRFAPEGVSQVADEWCGLAKSGVINGVSIGFNPLGAPERIGDGGLRFKAWELLEVSMVAVGANVEALVVQRSHRADGRKSGRVISAENAEHIDALKKCVAAMSNCYVNALDSTTRRMRRFRRSPSI